MLILWLHIQEILYVFLVIKKVLHCVIIVIWWPQTVYLFIFIQCNSYWPSFWPGRCIFFSFYRSERLILVHLFYLFVVEKYSTIFFYNLKLRFVILTEKISFFLTVSSLKALLSFCVSIYLLFHFFFYRNKWRKKEIHWRMRRWKTVDFHQHYNQKFFSIKAKNEHALHRAALFYCLLVEEHPL